MDLWGLLWLLLAMVLFPFGYKPLVTLFSIATIFSAGKVFSIAGSDIPIFFTMELLVILRLILPFNGNKVLSFYDYKSFITIFLILILWIYSYLVAEIFSGIKVFSSAMSMEDNFSVGGVPLHWGGGNINQLLLLSVHLFLSLIFYKRRSCIDKDFYYKTIIFTTIIFIVISLIWKFSPTLYSIIGSIIFNNTNYAVNALFESRLSGTFLEPSLAGLYISCFCLLFLIDNRNYIKLISLIFIYLAILNLSSTLVISVAVSFLLFLILFHAKTRLDIKVLWCMSLILLSSIVLVFCYDYIQFYINTKSISQSGEVRSGANLNSINNFLKSYGLGLGLGSERTSSLFLTIFNNLGIILGPFLVLHIYRLLSPIKSDLDKILRFMLLISFFGSFFSIPELTGSVMWSLIFANILTGNNRNYIEVTSDKLRGSR